MRLEAAAGGRSRGIPVITGAECPRRHSITPSTTVAAVSWPSRASIASPHSRQRRSRTKPGLKRGALASRSGLLGSPTDAKGPLGPGRQLPTSFDDTGSHEDEEEH